MPNLTCRPSPANGLLPPGVHLFGLSDEEPSAVLTPQLLANAHAVWADDVKNIDRWLLKQLKWPGHCRQVYHAPLDMPAGLVVLGACRTTMESARTLAAQGLLSEFDGVVAAVQTQGRGQVRRHWSSPAGNVHLSLVLPKAGTIWDPLLPLVAGFLVATTLEHLGVKAKIKWPNDILVQGRKLAGLLIEERDGVPVLGLGVNVSWRPDPGELRQDHAAEAAMLRDFVADATPLKLCQDLVIRFKNGYEEISDAGDPSHFLTSITERLAWLGRRVIVREGLGAVYEARITGISPQGGLRLHRDGEDMTLFSGSVSPL